MSEVKARPMPIKRLSVPVVQEAPRLGLASIQAVAYEGENSTDATWAVVFESPEGEFITLSTGYTKGAKRSTAALAGERYGEKIKKVALLDAFSSLLSQREALNVSTVSVHCPDAQVVDELKSFIKSAGLHTSVVIGVKERFSSEFRWGRAWEAWPRAYKAAAELALTETLKKPLEGATDGSLNPHAKGAGSGWVLADGRCGASLVDKTEVLAAELNGIRDLLSVVDKHQAVRIKIDSREAIRVTRDILTKGAHEATKNLSGIVNTIGHDIQDLAEGLHIELQWVRGHNGDPLNEAADQLALAASRHHRGLLNRTELNQVVDRVRNEIVS